MVERGTQAPRHQAQTHDQTSRKDVDHVGFPRTQSMLPRVQERPDREQKEDQCQSSAEKHGKPFQDVDRPAPGDSPLLDVQVTHLLLHAPKIEPLESMCLALFCIKMQTLPVLSFLAV